MPSKPLNDFGETPKELKKKLNLNSNQYTNQIANTKIEGIKITLNFGDSKGFSFFIVEI